MELLTKLEEIAEHFKARKDATREAMREIDNMGKVTDEIAKEFSFCHGQILAFTECENYIEAFLDKHFPERDNDPPATEYRP